MPPKRRLHFPSPSSSGENPPIPAPAHQGCDGDEEDSETVESRDDDSPSEEECSGDEVVRSDDLGENVMPPPPSKIGPAAELAVPPPPKVSPEAHVTKQPPQKKATATVANHESSPKKKAKTTPPKMPLASHLTKRTDPKKTATAPVANKNAKSRNKAAAAKQIAKSPWPKKAAAPAATAEVVKLPRAQGPAEAPTGAEEGDPVQVAALHNAEKHLEEKSARYRYLRQMLQSLEAAIEQPGTFDGPFLKMDDAMAVDLDNMTKEQWVAESQVFSMRWEIKKDVAMAMCDLIK